MSVSKATSDDPPARGAALPPRYRMTLAYDGTGFAGWQVQPHGRSIQQVLEEVLGRITGETPRVHGSGRTDAGVHAVGQVAHFELSRPRPAPDLRRSLNAVLPPEIRVLALSRARPDFHARKSAQRKQYRYFIWNSDPVPPAVRLYRTQVRARLDVVRMRRAAELLRGEHDFAAFTANPNRVVESTVRDLTQLDVRRRGHEVTIIASCEGFLYKMVRSLAGFLIRVGEGAVEPESARRVLESGERTARVPTAAPQGLFLWRVWY